MTEERQPRRKRETKEVPATKEEAVVKETPVKAVAKEETKTKTPTKGKKSMGSKAKKVEEKAEVATEKLSTRASLMAAFTKEAAADGVINLTNMDFPQSSGMDLFDFHNGSFSAETGKYSHGLHYGRIITFVGKTSSGKTSLAIAVALGMIKNIDGATAFHLDVERSTRNVRICNIGGTTEEDLRKNYTHITRDMTTENLHAMISNLHTFKMENEKELSLERTDTSGLTQTVLPPTIVLLDSISQLTTSKFDEDDGMGSNMSGGQTAGANARMLNKILGKLEEANIHLFIIGHITTKIQTGVIPATADIAYLSNTETIAGGKKALYLSDYLLRMQGTAVKYDPAEPTKNKYGDIKGFDVQLVVLKSRGFPAGVKFSMVFDQVRGFNNRLSNMEAMLKHKILTGKSTFAFEELPDVSFSRKTFIKKMNESRELRAAYKLNVVKLKEAIIPIVNKVEVINDVED